MLLTVGLEGKAAAERSSGPKGEPPLSLPERQSAQSIDFTAIFAFAQEGGGGGFQFCEQAHFRPRGGNRYSPHSTLSRTLSQLNQLFRAITPLPRHGEEARPKAPARSFGPVLLDGIATA